MRKIVILIITLLCPKALAAETVIRVAVVENLKFEKLSTDKYAKDYLAGIAAAAEESKQKGYKLQLEYFFYEKEPLAILKLLPKVEAWQPDLVIGPRSSAFFLMLCNSLKDVLVISPFATASAVATMPSNFYSMTLPNSYMTHAAVRFVAERFPGRAVSPIVEVDCKNCMDFADEFSRLASTHGMALRAKKTFLGKNAETTAIKPLLSETAASDVLLVPNTSYTSGVIIPRLADELRSQDLIVIGGDGWGDWSSSYVGKVKSSHPYAGYRLTPWSFDVKDADYARFQQAFQAAHRVEASGIASLIAYNALNAAIAVLPQGGLLERAKPRPVILEAFQDRLVKEPNYGRPVSYAIYKLTQDGETFVGSVSALTSEKK